MNAGELRVHGPWHAEVVEEIEQVRVFWAPGALGQLLDPTMAVKRPRVLGRLGGRLASVGSPHGHTR